MKISLLLFIVLVLCNAKLVAQSADEKAIKNLIFLQNESIIKKDTAAFISLYLHDEKIKRTYISDGGVYKIEGWNSLSKQISQWVLSDPSPSKYTDLKDNNYIIRIGSDMATIEFDQKTSAPGIDSLKPYYTHEFRTLMKVNNRWRIALQ